MDMSKELTDIDEKVAPKVGSKGYNKLMKYIKPRSGETERRKIGTSGKAQKILRREIVNELMNLGQNDDLIVERMVSFPEYEWCLVGLERPRQAIRKDIEMIRKQRRLQVPPEDRGIIVYEHIARLNTLFDQAMKVYANEPNGKTKSDTLRLARELLKDISAAQISGVALKENESFGGKLLSEPNKNSSSDIRATDGEDFIDPPSEIKPLLQVPVEDEEVEYVEI